MPQVIDEELIRRLPYPLAQLYRDAHNTRTPKDRQFKAYCLWEASLKLMATVALAGYAERAETDPQTLAKLDGVLKMPTTGLWLRVVNTLLSEFASGPEAGLVKLNAQIHGRSVSNMMYVVELHNQLRANAKRPRDALKAIRLHDLFDLLVNHRNLEFHDRMGSNEDDFYKKMASAILSGVSELLARLDVLAGGRMIYIDSVSRRPSGRFLVDGIELKGEGPSRIDLPEFAGAPDAGLPLPERVYLAFLPAGGATPEVGPPPPPAPAFWPLHPLVAFDPVERDFFFYARTVRNTFLEYHNYVAASRTRGKEFAPGVRPAIARILGQGDAAPPMPGHPPEEKDTPGHEAERAAAAPDAGDLPEAIDRYPVLGLLGKGAHGTVFRVHQEPPMSREVALKRFHATLDREFHHRFIREIQMLERVKHPNLINIYDAKVVDGCAFYTMELIPGASLAAVFGRLQTRSSGDASHLDLSTWMEAVTEACDLGRRAAAASRDEAPLPAPADGPFARSAVRPLAGESYVRTAVDLVRQVAEAAHALHEAGIVHRDIKPSNIMITADHSKAILMDLGVALEVQADQALTEGGAFLGTLRYASPEQVTSAHHIDRRTDIYSLGAILWELLCLRPFREPARGISQYEFMQLINEKDPPRVREYYRGIARDLDLIVRKCLERKREERYATADELAEDLGRWLRGEPVAARPRTLRYVVAEYVHRHRRRVITAAVVAATWIIGAPGFFWWESHRERGLRVAAQEAEAHAEKTVDQFFTEVSENELNRLPRMKEFRSSSWSSPSSTSSSSRASNGWASRPQARGSMRRSPRRISTRAGCWTCRAITRRPLGSWQPR
jgi:serine/threonine protein kinase